MRTLNNLLRFLFDLSPYLVGPETCDVETVDATLDKEFKVRVYKPYNRELRLVMLYYHGGGWVIGSIKAYDKVLRYLSYKAECIVVAVGYRKAPEYKFPVALNDAYSAYQWVISNIIKTNQGITKIILGGDSAGGNLAINVLRLLNKQALYLPSLLVLFYPLLVRQILYSSGQSYLIYVVSQKILYYCLKQSFHNVEEDMLRYVSLAENFDKNAYYPTTLIVTAGLDALNDSIYNYVGQLRSIGVKVILDLLHNLRNWLRFLVLARI
jgi:acetyl esterase